MTFKQLSNKINEMSAEHQACDVLIYNDIGMEICPAEVSLSIAAGKHYESGYTDVPYIDII